MSPVVEHPDMISEIWYPQDDDFVNDIAGFDSTDNFVMRWSGFITLTTAGEYMFQTESDDGSVLFIDHQMVVDNDGLHGTTAAQGSVTLSEGRHSITIGFFENNGGAAMMVSWTPVPGTGEGGLEHLNANVLSNSVSCADNTDTGTCAQTGFFFEAYDSGSEGMPGGLTPIVDTVFGDVWNGWTPLIAHTEDESALVYPEEESFRNEIPGFDMHDHFHMRWRGVLTVPTAGEYAFKTISDDGSMLFVDEELVVDNDGDHGSREVEGSATLAAGGHRITIVFYENGGGALMQAWWTPSPGAEMVPMEASSVTNDVECEAGAEACETIESYNTETYDTILSRELGPAKAVTFSVRAPNDAHVGFFSRARSLDEVYEIVIGGWGDTQSAIRESNQVRAETLQLVLDPPLTCLRSHCNSGMLTPAGFVGREPGRGADAGHCECG